MPLVCPGRSYRRGTDRRRRDETMQTRPLPPVPSLSEHQQRGWRCCWCRWPLSPGYDVAVGEVRVVPPTGATYTVFMRACADTAECAEREQQQRPGVAP